jgi:hypothetical protein
MRSHLTPLKRGRKPTPHLFSRYLRFFPRFSGGSRCAAQLLHRMGAPSNIARPTLASFAPFALSRETHPLRQYVLFLFSAISAMFGAVDR